LRILLHELLLLLLLLLLQGQALLLLLHLLMLDLLHLQFLLLLLVLQPLALLQCKHLLPLLCCGKLRVLGTCADSGSGRIRGRPAGMRVGSRSDDSGTSSKPMHMSLGMQRVLHGRAATRTIVVAAACPPRHSGYAQVVRTMPHQPVHIVARIVIVILLLFMAVLLLIIPVTATAIVAARASSSSRGGGCVTGAPCSRQRRSRVACMARRSGIGTEHVFDANLGHLCIEVAIVVMYSVSFVLLFFFVALLMLMVVLVCLRRVVPTPLPSVVIIVVVVAIAAAQAGAAELAATAVVISTTAVALLCSRYRASTGTPAGSGPHRFHRGCGCTDRSAPLLRICAVRILLLLPAILLFVV
jgi:hypothetical protein